MTLAGTDLAVVTGTRDCPLYVIPVQVSAPDEVTLGGPLNSHRAKGRSRRRRERRERGGPEGENTVGGTPFTLILEPHCGRRDSRHKNATTTRCIV